MAEENNNCSVSPLTLLMEKQNNKGNVPKRVSVSVTNDLVTDQRVYRSCHALHEAGYAVTLIGRMLDDRTPLNRPYRTVRMRLLFRKGPLFYASFNVRLFLRLLFARTDAFYANDTDTLLANYLAARLRRKPLFFDAHEMFPEVPELVGRPRVKAVWEGLERCMFPRMAKMHHCAAVTVCQSIADIYRQRYGLPMAVVRNVPIANAMMQVRDHDFGLPHDRKILLYQGAVNVGRGIEWVMEAMPYLDGYQLVVAGVGDEYERLSQRAAAAKFSDRVTFLGRVQPEVLHALTGKATLGLSLLANRGLNYYYSLPNRIADFVQAGVPVLATDFPEIHRVVETYGIGTLVPPIDEGTAPDPVAMAQIIKDAVESWSSIAADEKQRRFERAAKELSWEHDKKTLLASFDAIF